MGARALREPFDTTTLPDGKAAPRQPWDNLQERAKERGKKARRAPLPAYAVPHRFTQKGKEKGGKKGKKRQKNKKKIKRFRYFSINDDSAASPIGSFERGARRPPSVFVLHRRAGERE